MLSISIVHKLLGSGRRPMTVALAMAVAPTALFAQGTGEAAQPDSSKTAFQIGPAISGTSANDPRAIQIAPGQTKVIQLGPGKTMMITTRGVSRTITPSGKDSVVQFTLKPADSEALENTLKIFMENTTKSGGVPDAKALQEHMTRMMQIVDSATVAASQEKSSVEVRADTTGASPTP